VIEYLGWAATAVFVASYLCKRPAALKRVQMAGAAMWVAYGVLIQATPVVAANVLVFTAAGWALARGDKTAFVASAFRRKNDDRIQRQPHPSA
jgi:hypothetical protein